MIHIHIILIRFHYISFMSLKFPVPIKLTKSSIYCICNNPKFQKCFDLNLVLEIVARIDCSDKALRDEVTSLT